MHRVKTLYPAIIDALTQCSNWEDQKTVEKATDLLRNVATKDFALSLVASEHFLSKLTAVVESFQKKTVDLKSAKKALEKQVHGFSNHDIIF